ncbi:MAG: hypothetical protein SGPRY_009035, partial [Prymnesium sp.]
MKEAFARSPPKPTALGERRELIDCSAGLVGNCTPRPLTFTRDSQEDRTDMTFRIAAAAAEAAQLATPKLLGDECVREVPLSDTHTCGRVDNAPPYREQLSCSSRLEERGNQQHDIGIDRIDEQPQDVIAAEIADDAVLAELKKTIALTMSKPCPPKQSKRTGEVLEAPALSGASTNVRHSSQLDRTTFSEPMGWQNDSFTRSHDVTDSQTNSEEQWVVLWDGVSCPPALGKQKRSISVVDLAEQLATHAMAADGVGRSARFSRVRIYLTSSVSSDGSKACAVDLVRRGEIARVNKIIGSMPQVVPVDTCVA